ncbi:MAG TPA: hypothetical protein DCZ12_05850 [Gammaproteobacteria bacterium]|nr:hypothetical protein [Gammaproteobacteria bacterium]
MRTLRRLGFMVVALGVVLVTTASAATVVNFAAYVPTKHIVMQDVLIPFFNDVEKETNGSITFKLHAGGSLASGKGSLAAVRDGLAEGALLVDLYTPKELAAIGMISGLAMLGKDPRVMSAASNEMILLSCPECLKSYQRHSVTPLALYATSAYKLMCREPVKSIEDIKGRKIRAVGPYGIWAKELGAVPVRINSAEGYEALERGQLDCLVGSLAWLKSYSYWDVVKHVVDFPLGTYHAAAFFNLRTDVWEGLSKEEKKVIIDRIPAMIARAANLYLELDESIKKTGTAEHGLQFADPDPKLVEMMKTHQQKEIKRVAAQGDKRKVKNAEEIVNTYLEKVKKWEKIVAETGGDEAKFTEALRQEIFSKIQY